MKIKINGKSAIYYVIFVFFGPTYAENRKIQMEIKINGKSAIHYVIFVLFGPTYVEIRKIQMEGIINGKNVIYCVIFGTDPATLQRLDRVDYARIGGE